MNEQPLATKIRQTVVKTKDDLTTRVEDGVYQLSETVDKLEQMADDAKETVAEAAVTVKKDVRQGISQYNAKAQEVADKVPGGLGKKARRYPWVAISIALVTGILLGSVIRTASHSH